MGFVLVFAWRVEPLVFGIESVGLFENPTVSVGMVSRLPRSTVYLTYPVQDFIQVGWIVPIILGGDFN